MVSRAAPPTDTAPDTDYPDALDAGLLRIAGVCILGSVMAILDGTVVSVAQRTFIAEFSSTQAVVAWTITGYTLGQATVIPLAGWASDRFGTKRLFMAAALWFTLASLLCSTASNISHLIAFRVIQGLGSGMLVPLTLIILTREAGPRRLGRLMAVLGIPMLLAPMCGPVLGGWLISAYGWEWIFRINLPIGVILLVCAASIFPRDRPRPSEAFDFVGMLLLSPGLALLLFGISSVPRRDSFTDNHVWMPGLTGIVLIVAFVVHALHRTDHPLIDLALFKKRAVTLSNAAMFSFSVGFFGAALVVPSYLQQLLHETPLQSGLQLIPQGLGAMLTMPLAGTLMDKRGPRNVLLAGVTLIATGLSVFAYGAWQEAEYLPTLLVGLVTTGIGLGCTLTPLSGAAVQMLAPHEVARGSTLLSVNQHVAVAVGTALTSVILTSQFNRSATIHTAEKLGILRGKFSKHGAPAPSHQEVSADFTVRLMHDLTHSYTLVLMVSIVVVAVTLLPVAFLANKPPPAGRAQSTIPV
jgi:EmrB/QacA subfamily drug resistance transporter